MSNEDRILFKAAIEKYKKLRNLSKHVENKHPDVPFNVWNDFFQPYLEETDHPLVKQVRRSPRFDKMRETTALNRPSTSLAAVSILKAIKEGKIKLPEKQEKPEEAPQTPLEDTEVPALYDVENDEKTPETEADGEKEPETPEQAPEDVENDFQKLLEEEKGEGVTQAEQEEMIQEAVNEASIDEALQEAEQKMRSMRSLMRAAGLGEGATQEIPEETWEKFVPFVEENKNIEELLELAGRLYRTIDTKKRHSYVKGSGVIVGVETGNKVERLLPSELAKVKNPLLRSEFYRGLIEGSLLQFELEDKEPTKQGPVFVCVDQSGSMSGNPDKWAKALSLAIARTMKQENRAFAFLPFDSHPGEVIYGEANGSSNKLNFEKLMPILTSFRGGGTSFINALHKAMEFINENEQFNKNADIIFITDGNDGLNEDYQKRIAAWKEEKGVSILGVQIGGSTRYLEKFCDSIVLIGKSNNMNEKDDDIIRWILTPKERRVK